MCTEEHEVGQNVKASPRGSGAKYTNFTKGGQDLVLHSCAFCNKARGVTDLQLCTQQNERSILKYTLGKFPTHYQQT